MKCEKAKESRKFPRARRMLRARATTAAAAAGAWQQSAGALTLHFRYHTVSFDVMTRVRRRRPVSGSGTSGGSRGISLLEKICNKKIKKPTQTRVCTISRENRDAVRSPSLQPHSSCSAQNVPKHLMPACLSAWLCSPAVAWHVCSLTSTKFSLMDFEGSLTK